MNNSKKVYDCCIIGGGITGLACAELLSRENKSVILVEKNKKLVGETSAEFHEWFHLGSLYSIKQDNNSTIKTLLNSFKKVNEFYSEFKNFNIELKKSGFEFSVLFGYGYHIGSHIFEYHYQTETKVEK